MDNKRICYVLYAAVAVVLIIICTAFYINSREKVEQPKVIPQTTMSNPVELAKEIKVTPKQASQIVEVIPQSKPVITYTVVAPVVEKAAVKTAEAIKNKSPDIPKKPLLILIELLLYRILKNIRLMFTKSILTRNIKLKPAQR